MAISQSIDFNENNWLKSLHDVLTKELESGLQSQQLLLENPGFLKAVLTAFLSMIDEKCHFGGIEVTRVLDLDVLRGIPEDCEIGLRVVRDYGGRDYLEITVHDQSSPLKKPKSTDPWKM